MAPPGVASQPAVEGPTTVSSPCSKCLEACREIVDTLLTVLHTFEGHEDPHPLVCMPPASNQRRAPRLTGAHGGVSKIVGYGSWTRRK